MKASLFIDIFIYVKRQSNHLCSSTEYPEFPEDFSIQIIPNDTLNCILLNETRDHSWGTRYFCYKRSSKKLNITWSRNGPINGMNCVNTIMPHGAQEQYWENTYLCTPRDSVFKFYWSVHGQLFGKACLKVRHGCYLCAVSRNKKIGKDCSLLPLDTEIQSAVLGPVQTSN